MFASIQDRAPLRRLVVAGAAVCSVALASACTSAGGGRAAPADPRPPAHPPASAAADASVATATPAAGTSPSHAAPTEGYLTAIRVAQHPAYDRVVFQFAGGVPRYTVSYVPGVAKDASGQPVPLPGQAYLRVVFHPASEIRQNPSGSPLTTRTYTGPPTITPLFSTLLRISAAGDFEGYLSFGIGLSGHAGFHAYPLAGPDQVVLDIAPVHRSTFPGIWDITSWHQYWAAQSSVAEGHQPWLLSPSSVVRAWAGGSSQVGIKQTGPNTFKVTKPGTSRVATVTGTRPVSTGPAPIWVITHVSWAG
jgi:hypothetical protein